MKNTISNRTPEGTCGGDVVGGCTVTGRAFGRFYLGRRRFCMEEHVYSEEKELSGYQSDVDRYVRSPLWLLLDVALRLVAATFLDCCP